MAENNPPDDGEEFISLEGLDALAPEEPAFSSSDLDSTLEGDEVPPPPTAKSVKSEVASGVAAHNQWDRVFALYGESFVGELKALQDIKPAEEGDFASEVTADLLRQEKFARLQQFLYRVRWLAWPVFWLWGQKSQLPELKPLLKDKAREFFIYAKGEGKDRAIVFIKQSWIWLKTPTVKAYKTWGRWKWQARWMLFGSIGLVAGLFFLAKPILTGIFLPAFVPQELNRFDGVASSVKKYDVAKGLEPFDSPLRLPEYIVQLKRIVVNLRKENKNDETPWGAFEFYIEASNQEAAVELHDREAEFIDLMQRTIEGMTYRELNLVEGKARLKKDLRQVLNDRLTKGRVRKLYISVMILKP